MSIAKKMFLLQPGFNPTILRRRLFSPVTSLTLVFAQCSYIQPCLHILSQIRWLLDCCLFLRTKNAFMFKVLNDLGSSGASRLHPLASGSPWDKSAQKGSPQTLNTHIVGGTIDSCPTIARIFYVGLYVVKIQGPLRGQLVIPSQFTIHWDVPLVFWLLRTQAEGSYSLAKLLSKRPRLKYKNGSKSVIYWPILMKFCMQLSNGHSFPLTKFQLGRKGQRPEGRKVKDKNLKRQQKQL